MSDSNSITVTNYRLKQALSGANDEDLKKHTKQMGEKLKSELTLQIGEVVKFFVASNKASVKLNNNSKSETCLIAHNTFSEGMYAIGLPQGTFKVENGKSVLIPSETIYGVIAKVKDNKGKERKVLLSYVILDTLTTPLNLKSGEYRIQVGKDNYISLTDKWVNLRGNNLFINGLPYTEAYTPLEDYNDKEEIEDLNKGLEDKIKKLEERVDKLVQLNSLRDEKVL